MGVLKVVLYARRQSLGFAAQSFLEVAMAFSSILMISLFKTPIYLFVCGL